MEIREEEEYDNYNKKDNIKDSPLKDKLFNKEDLDLVLFINDTYEKERFEWIEQKYPDLIQLEFSTAGFNTFEKLDETVKESIIKRLLKIEKDPINIRLCITAHNGKTFGLKKDENLKYIEDLLFFINKFSNNKIINFELKWYTCFGIQNIVDKDFENIFKKNQFLKNRVNMNIKCTTSITNPGLEYKNIKRAGGGFTYSKEVPHSTKSKYFKKEKLKDPVPKEYKQSQREEENIRKTGFGRHYVNGSLETLDNKNLSDQFFNANHYNFKVKWKNIIINKIPENLKNKEHEIS